jgi:hypothetical protein
VITIDSSLGALVWNLGRTCVTGMDVSAQLSSVCAALPAALCVAGAVVLLSEPLDASGSVVFASDGQAGWIGDCQRRAGQGPLIAALRSGRPLLTPDMARIDPHEVAAAASVRWWCRWRRSVGGWVVCSSSATSGGPWSPGTPT